MIWSYTKEKILERPLVGHGFFSSRFIGEDYKIIDIKNDKKSAIPLHPHNFIMQVWLELGLLGIIVFYFFIYNLIKRLKPFTEKQFYLSAFPIVSFIQVFFIGQLSYGFWQSWWIAIIIINFMLYSILFADEIEVKKPLLK
jgi:O-antigen ligase